MLLLSSAREQSGGGWEITPPLPPAKYSTSLLFAPCLLVCVAASLAYILIEHKCLTSYFIITLAFILPSIHSRCSYSYWRPDSASPILALLVDLFSTMSLSPTMSLFFLFVPFLLCVHYISLFHFFPSRQTTVCQMTPFLSCVLTKYASYSVLFHDRVKLSFLEPSLLLSPIPLPPPSGILIQAS